MKKYILIVISINLLFILININCFAQISWTASNTGLPSSSYVNDFALSSNGDIYIIVNSSGQGQLYKSSNNGSSWTSVSTTGLPTGGWANSLFIKNSTMFLSTGDLGSDLYISSNNGQSWTASNTGLPSSSYVNDFAISSNGDIYIIVNSSGQGQLYKSSNNGSSWTSVSTTGLPTGGWANSLFIKNSTMFLSTGDLGSDLYISSNNGQSWTASNTGLPSSSYVNDFAISSNGDIYIIVNSSGQGQLYKSSNNGSSWTSVSTTGLPTGGWANSLFIKNSTMFLGTGDLGSDLYRSTISTGINEENSFKILSVFPTPSNGQINVLCSNRIDEIIVTDLLGQIIYEIKPNNLNVSFCIEKTGIYFINIISDNQTITKKIIISL